MRKIGVALIVVLSSCSVDKINNDFGGQDIKQISVNIEDIIEEGTGSRVIRENGGQFVWEANDTLGIFPNKGGQVEFPIDASNVGSSFAVFDGGGWALKSNYTYSAYCPFNFYNRDVKAIPFSYMKQVYDGQGTKGSLSHLFMAAPPTIAENNSLTFNVKHLGTVTELTLTMPEATTYTSLDIYTSDKIFPVEVTFDLSSADLLQKNIKYSNHYSIELKNITTTTENEVVTVWFTTPVVVDKAKTLKVVVKDEKGNLYADDIRGVSSGNVAVVNFPRASKRSLKASPVQTTGIQAGIEDWEIGEEILGSAN